MNYRETSDLQPSEKQPSPKQTDFKTDYNLYLNLLPFEHPDSLKTIYFSQTLNTDKFRFHFDKLPKEMAGLFPGISKENPFVYTRFQPFEGAPLMIRMGQHPAVAKAYYTDLIREYFRDIAHVIADDYIGDTQLWFENIQQDSDKYRIFKKYTLRIQFCWETQKPELMVSYDGYSLVSIKSLDTMMSDEIFDPALLRKIIFRKRLYQYRHLPPEATYHPDEAFPLIKNPVPPTSQTNNDYLKSRQKHSITIKEIQDFYEKHLNNNSFKKIIPHCGQWKPIRIDHIRKIDTKGNQLVFGEGNMGSDAYKGLKDYGPAVPSPHRLINYFFIYDRKDEDLARNLLAHIRKEKGFLELRSFTRTWMLYSKEHNIAFDSEQNPLTYIKNQIARLNLDPLCSYFAFYISPWTKFELEDSKRIIYYKLKELLLRRSIQMQAFEKEKLLNGNVPYFMANIGVAMLAKLGGIPWRLNQPVENELIIGFGAFRSSKYNRKFVGAAFCFSNDGSFEEFDCFPAGDAYAIAGAAELALLNYRTKHPEVKQMVIHFYKQISEKELKPIENMLRKLKFDIPVIIVSINKSRSKHLLAFMNDKGCSMPTNGTYTKIGKNHFLLNINDKNSTNPSQLPSKPLPLKVSITSNQENPVPDHELTDRLMTQLYGFCFMYWRSVKHSSLPVTITYPEMLASIFPWFDDEALSEEGSKTLWFL